jgi:hypothetical protein
VVSCTARGTHACPAPTSEIHTQERVVHAPARGGRNEAQSRTPGSRNAGDAGGGARYGRRLMGKSRSGFENDDLQDTKKPANGTSKVTIHDDGVAGKEGMMQLLFLKGQG